MAERIVSPGVFTQESDQTYLAQGVAQIGAAFVGPTRKGPAFIPIVVDGQKGLENTFGTPDGNSYINYTVQNYLQEAGSATVVRVLGLGGYSTNTVTVFASGSNGYKVFAVLHPTLSGSSLTGVTVGGNTASFSLTLTGSGNVSASASGISPVESSTSFITKVIGSAPLSTTTTPAYVYAVYPNALAQAGSGVSITASLSSLSLLNQYSNATTPWIRSQTIGGAKYNLFKLHTLNDGTNANTDIKVSVVGVVPSGSSEDSPYGKFSIFVRDINDTDDTPSLLEPSWDNLTLDPNSPNYIARVLGNSAPFYDVSTGETYYQGDYPNKSKYIRVELSSDPIPENAVPFGFAALRSTVSSSAAEVVSGSYVTSRWLTNGVPGYSSTATANPQATFYGFNFKDTNSRSYLGPLVGSNTVGSEFNLENLYDIPNGAASSSISLTDTNVQYRQFTVPVQGGFDGLNPAREIAMGGAIRSTNTQGFDLSTSLKSGSVEYKRALDSLSNPDSVDFNLLVVPGVLYSQHSYIAQYAMDLCLNRGDCFYILDLDQLNASVSNVTSQARSINTNYAAAYYPWVSIIDTNTNKQMWAPPSVVLPEVYAYSDNVGAEWFAPAGLNRGGIPGAIGVKVRLNQAQRDTLYEAKVNPIAQFPGQGICVWGQKTLQTRSSALDRVNVRRLLITVKKYIASTARYLVFEQNTEATRNRFLNIVNPYLATIQQNSGLTAFKVVMDETNNTPDIIDRNILAGAIYLQPTRTAEFIKLDFNILPTGATFDTI